MRRLVIKVGLPLSHSQYNPMELISVKVEGKNAQFNNTFRLSDGEMLMGEVIDRNSEKTGF
jgi:hypothetical protein